MTPNEYTTPMAMGQPRLRRLAAANKGVVGRITTPAWGSGILVGVLGLAAVNADAYTAVTLSRMLVLGLLAASVAVLAGWCGLPSLGQTAPFAVGAYTTAVLLQTGLTAGPVLIAAAMVAGAGFAVVTLLVLRTRGTVFLMVSLAVGELVAVAVTQWVSVTGGSDGTFGIPATTWWWHTTALVDDKDIYGYVLAVTVVMVAATMTVLRSPAGLLLRGVRDNEARMRAAGHRVDRYLLLAYTGAAAVAAVGGSLLVSLQRYVSPADAGFDVAALVLLAVVIGGTTSIVGAFTGAALIVLTRDWLAGPWPGHAPLLVGVLLILTVYLFPSGLAGSTRQWLRRADRPRK